MLERWRDQRSGRVFTVCNSLISHNGAIVVGGGGAPFFVSYDRSATVSIVDSTLRANPSHRFETAGLPGIFVLAAPGQQLVTRSTILKYCRPGAGPHRTRMPGNAPGQGSRM